MSAVLGMADDAVDPHVTSQLGPSTREACSSICLSQRTALEGAIERLTGERDWWKQQYDFKASVVDEFKTQLTALTAAHARLEQERFHEVEAASIQRFEFWKAAEARAEQAEAERDKATEVMRQHWIENGKISTMLGQAEAALAECKGRNPLSGNPSDWGHAAVIEGLTRQRDEAEAALAVALGYVTHKDGCACATLRWVPAQDDPRYLQHVGYEPCTCGAAAVLSHIPDSAKGQ